MRILVRCKVLLVVQSHVGWNEIPGGVELDRTVKAYCVVLIASVCKVLGHVRTHRVNRRRLNWVGVHQGNAFSVVSARAGLVSDLRVQNLNRSLSWRISTLVEPPRILNSLLQLHHEGTVQKLADCRLFNNFFLNLVLVVHRSILPNLEISTLQPYVFLVEHTQALRRYEWLLVVAKLTAFHIQRFDLLAHLSVQEGAPPLFLVETLLKSSEFGQVLPLLLGLLEEERVLSL